MPGSRITKAFMADAFKQLLAEKPIAKISVSDIVGRCNVSRPSFYYHFSDKYDLLNWVFTDEFQRELEKLEPPTNWQFAYTLCVYLQKNKQYYQNALAADSQNSLSETIFDFMKRWTMWHSGNELLEIEDHEFYINFVLDAVLGAIRRWMAAGAKTDPEKLVSLTIHCIEGYTQTIHETRSGSRPFFQHPGSVSKLNKI